MKKTVHIISHTHWDREWYLNSKFVNRWIPVFFEALFAMLEKEPEYQFVLDGQTSILDDCYTELEKLGQDVGLFKEKLRRYVEAGRIILGPYYLQPDWQLISEESLVRNMLYGKKISEEFGGGTSTGWLLDNFGQISQAPQIHKEFGMKGIVIWRGVEFDPEHLQSEFYWKSPDGTMLPCIYLLSSYRNAMRLADDPDHIYGRIKNEAEKIAPFATTSNVLLMNGYDQEMNPDDILPYIKEGKADFGEFVVKQSNPDEYMEAVIKELGCLQTFSGPLYSGRYISVFPGILSCRMYLKTKNDKAQRLLEGYAEPISIMASLLGADYPKEQLDASWKLLLKNHPHDSICGVSVDDVHTDMEDRLGEVLHQVQGCLKPMAGKIVTLTDTSALDGACQVFQVFNTMLRKRSCQVLLPCDASRYYVVKTSDGKLCESQKCKEGILAKLSLPAFGYCTVGLYSKEDNPEAVIKEEPDALENAWIRVDFHANGSFDLTDKRNQKQYKMLGYLEDRADCGDEYNYSYLVGDIPYTTLHEKAKLCVVERGDLRTTVKINYEWKLPSALASGRNARSTAMQTMPITTYVTMEADSPVLQFHTVIRNCCKDHRIRVMFPTEIETSESMAQTQFDLTAHPIVPRQFDNSKIPEDVKRIIIGARESQPITQFPQRDFVAVSDGRVSAAVLNQGLPEYEVLPDKTTIALTLFRSVGWLARVDLQTRIGDAGPEIFTPDAQCLRDMEFRYAFCPVDGTIEAGRLLEAADNLNYAPLVVRTDAHKGVLRGQNSFANISYNGDIRITAVKQAQDGTGMIIRLFHVGDCEKQATLVFPDALEAFRCNLAEENEENLPVRDGEVTLLVPPKKIITLRVLYQTRQYEADIIESADICGMQQETEDFSAYAIPLAVTEEDICREERRAQSLKEQYQIQCREYEAEKNAEQISDKVQQGKRLAIAEMKMHSLHRAFLEAELSSIFTSKKQKELLWGRDAQKFAQLLAELESQIADLADRLNLARIAKRVSEYKVDYYNQLEHTDV